MKQIAIAAILVILCATGVQAQQVSNPDTVTFTSTDHATITEYRIGYFLPGAASPVQEASIGTGTVTGTGDIECIINTRPLTFGTYTAKVRAVAGEYSSAWSDPSAPFLRVPQTPAGLVVR
jgi:hypothetical protein